MGTSYCRNIPGGWRLADRRDSGMRPTEVAECALREARAAQLMTIRELAQLAGVAPSTIYSIESGRSTPHLAVVRRIAAALGVEARTISEFRRAIRVRSGLG